MRTVRCSGCLREGGVCLGVSAVTVSGQEVWQSDRHPHSLHYQRQTLPAQCMLGYTPHAQNQRQV